MYYIFNNDIEQVCNALNSYGFTKGKWSCEDKDAKAIALVTHSADDNGNVVKCKKYVLLSKSMMGIDPRFSWVEPYRKEVKNVQEFLAKCKELV